MVDFPNIPQSGILAPGEYLDELTTPGAGSGQRYPLMVGQVLAASPWSIAGKAGYPQQVVSLADVKANAGAGSMLARMVAAYQGIDKFSQVYVLPLLDDPSAIAGVQSILFTGPATAAGVIPLYIAGVPVYVPVTSGMTAIQIAAATVAAINAMPDLPCTAAVDGTTAAQGDITAKNKGMAAADIDLRFQYGGPSDGEVTLASLGIGATISTTTAGATNPSLTTPLGNLGDLLYDWIAFGGYTDSASLATSKAFMGQQAGRWAWNQLLLGHVFNAYRGSYAQQSTFGLAQNDPHITVEGVYDSPTTMYEWSAQIAAASAVSTLADPATGIDAALPGVAAPLLASRFPKFPNRNQLLLDGVSTFKVVQGQVVIEKLVTMVQTNQQGQPDTTYRDVETVYCVMAILRAFKTSRAKFSRKPFNTTLQNPPDGSQIVTSGMLYSSDLACYKQLERMGFVQDSAGFAKAWLTQQNSMNPNRFDTLLSIVTTDRIDIQAMLFDISTSPSSS